MSESGRVATVVNEPALSTRALSSVPYQVEGALTKAQGNLTRAAKLLNESGHRSAAGKAWDRRSVAAATRRLKLLP
jgi:hypothetical protein